MPVEAEPRASEQCAPLQRMRYSAAQVMADEDKVNAYQQQNDFPELCRVQERGNSPAGVAICRQHDFLDLCPGPLVEHTGQNGPFKLMSLAGSHWRGDEHRPMLQRLYGPAGFAPGGLRQYPWRVEEAQKSDPRKLGRGLGLFM